MYLTELVRRDNVGYCASCREFRTSGGFSLALQREKAKSELWYSDCEDTHTQLLFSAAQQAVNDNASRICIGHQGCVEVCRHGVGFNWSKAQANDVKNASYSHWQHATPARCLAQKSRRATNSDSDKDTSNFEPRAYMHIPLDWSRIFGWGMHVFDDDLSTSSPPMTRRCLTKLIVEALPSTTMLSVRFCPHVEVKDLAKLLTFPFSVDQCACFDDEEDAEAVAAAVE
ncbi:hypothetical protein Sste5346_004950 [Sporothrix stenoceras]|uniref:Uncharacterized protein n=1 Tax=Sporothrix stenoceras TaxID=5173 RepID=A0ABR3Z5E1_9PEZI